MSRTSYKITIKLNSTKINCSLANIDENIHFAPRDLLFHFYYRIQLKQTRNSLYFRKTKKNDKEVKKKIHEKEEKILN